MVPPDRDGDVVRGACFAGRDDARRPAERGSGRGDAVQDVVLAAGEMDVLAGGGIDPDARLAGPTTQFCDIRIGDQALARLEPPYRGDDLIDGGAFRDQGVSAGFERTSGAHAV